MLVELWAEAYVLLLLLIIITWSSLLFCGVMARSHSLRSSRASFFLITRAGRSSLMLGGQSRKAALVPFCSYVGSVVG